MPAKARKKTSVGSASVMKSGEPIQIVIVDDHPIVRKGLTQLVNQQDDMNVCADVEDAHQALKSLNEFELDLMIIDLTLKDIGGLELIKQIHQLKPSLPMLVLSMHDETLYAERALRAGAQGYIMKQEGTDKMINAIRTVMSGHVYLSEKMSSRMLGRFVGNRQNTEETPMDRLSDRELEVFELIGRGMSTREIAERLCVSIKTIESHREHIKQKLQIRNASELVQHATQWVMQEGLD